MSTTATGSEITATPILDRCAPLPESPSASRSHGALIATLIGVSVPIICIFLMAWSPRFLAAFEGLTSPLRRFLDQATDVQDYGLSRLFVIAWYPLLSLMAAILVHEAGHLIAGLCSGFRPFQIRFGAIQMHFPFRVGVVRGLKTGASASVTMLPKDTSGLRWRSIVMTLGGPGANLLSCGLILKFSGEGSLFTGLFGMLSLVFGIGNLVPFRRLATMSDGARIWMLVKDREQGERWMALLRLSSDLVSGINPESLPQDFIKSAISIRDGSPDTVTAHAIAYSSAWYQHKDTEAAHFLEICLQYLRFSAPAIRQAILSDAAVFQARRRNRVDLAQHWLAEVPENTLIPGQRLRGEAAILEAQGDLKGALEKLDEVERLILTRPSPTQRRLSLRSLGRWKSELKAKIDSVAETCESPRV